MGTRNRICELVVPISVLDRWLHSGNSHAGRPRVPIEEPDGGIDFRRGSLHAVCGCNLLVGARGTSWGKFN